MQRKGFDKLLKFAGIAAPLLAFYLYVVPTHAWWVLATVALVLVVALFAVIIDRGKAFSPRVCRRISRVSLFVVYGTYITLAGILVVFNPPDMQGVPWTFLVVWVLLVGVECSIMARVAGVPSAGKARHYALLRIAAISVVGTALAGLAAGAGGIAYGLLHAGHWQGAITFCVESLGLAGAAAVILVGRRFTVFAATMGLAPMVAGFGVAAIESNDVFIGASLVALGLMIGVLGVAIARARAAVVGGFLFIGSLLAGVAAVASWFGGRSGLSFPYLVLTVALLVACVIFLTVQPEDPYRASSANRPWGMRRHKVTAAFGMAGFLSIGVGALVAAIHHEVGVATALLGTALGCAFFTIAVILSAARRAGGTASWERLASGNHVPPRLTARRDGAPTHPTPTVTFDERES